MPKRIDLRNPLVHFLIALVAAAAGYLISYVVQGSKLNTTDALAGLFVATAVQISFISYELNLVRHEISALPFFVDGPPARASSLIALLRSIPEIDKDVLTLSISDVSKGKIWLDFLTHAEVLDATCCLDPLDWCLASDGQKALKIQRQRISDGELKVRRIFVLRDEDMANSSYRKHINDQVSIGVDTRWIRAGDDIVSSWTTEMKNKFGSPDISLFTIHDHELLYWTQLDDKNKEVAGHYRVEGYFEAKALFEKLFNQSNKVERLESIGRKHSNNTPLAS